MYGAFIIKNDAFVTNTSPHLQTLLIFFYYFHLPEEDVLLFFSKSLGVTPNCLKNNLLK